MTTLYFDPGHPTMSPDGSESDPYTTLEDIIADNGPIYTDVEGTQTAVDDFLVLCTNTDNVPLGSSTISGTFADLNGHTVEFHNNNLSGYFLMESSNANHFTIRNNRVTKIVGWEIDHTLNSATNSLNTLRADESQSIISFERCLFKAGGVAFFLTTSVFGNSTTFNNCIIIGQFATLNHSGPVGISARRGAVTLNNCTMLNMPQSRSHNDGDVTIRNTYVGDSSFGDVWFLPDASHKQPTTVVTSSISDDAITTSGIIQNVSVESCNFENTTIGSQDIRTGSGSALHGEGTDIGPDGTAAVSYTDDHYGTSRPQGDDWDIGAFEYVSVGGTDALTADSIATGAPVLDEPTLTQVHALSASGLEAGSPVLDQASVGQLHDLDANDLAGGAPTLGSPTIAQGHALDANDLTSGTPALGTPVLAEVLPGFDNLDANGLLSGLPVLGAATIAQIHALVAAGIISATPDLGQPTVAGIAALTANALVAGSPDLGGPTFAQFSTLSANDLLAEGFVLETPTLAGYGHLGAGSVLVGSPQLGEPTVLLGRVNELLTLFAAIDREVSVAAIIEQELVVSTTF